MSTSDGSDSRLRRALDQIEDGFFLLDRDRRYTFVDRGPGVPAEHLPHLFDRSWQAQPGSHQGVGLGLAIARGIVEAHGATSSVASAPGEGATFTVLLSPP